MQIKCAKCAYVEVDLSACKKNWIAFQCSNPNSIYFHSLLNVDLDGMPLPADMGIPWEGCDKGSIQSPYEEKY